MTRDDAVTTYLDAPHSVSHTPSSLRLTRLSTRSDARAPTSDRSDAPSSAHGYATTTLPAIAVHRRPDGYERSMWLRIITESTLGFVNGAILRAAVKHV